MRIILLTNNLILLRFISIAVFMITPFNCCSASIYINDAGQVGDLFTTLAGNDTTGNGSSALPYLTLSKAYSMAVPGDVIYADTGVYVSTATIAFNKTNIKIIGAGATNTIFESGSVSGTVRWGIISATDAQFSNFQITKYDCASDGIAVLVNGGIRILFDNIILYTNVGSAGQGALYITGSTTEVTIKNSNLPCNRVSSSNYGGALKITGARVSIINCSYSDNVLSAIQGSAILIEGNTANVSISDTLFENNEAGSGGAICITNGTVTINNSCFNSNKSVSNSDNSGGGAVLIQASTNGTTTNVTFDNCSFTNNNASGSSQDGGAVNITNLNSPTCIVVFKTCSFTTNDASDKGEDVYFDQKNSPTFDVTFKNNTFNTIYAGAKVNLFNNDFTSPWIKFEGLSSPTGISGNGDIVANGSGVAITKPEMTGVYTVSSSNTPTSLPVTNCVARFDGGCGTSLATFSCLTTNTWGNIATTATSNSSVYILDKGINSTKTITVATNASNIVFTCTSHGFIVNDWIIIEECTPSTFNGIYKITVKTANTFTVAKGNAPGAFVSGGTATKGNPIGWSRNAIPTTFEHVVVDYNYNTSAFGDINACMMTVKAGKTLNIENDSYLTAGEDANGTYVYVVNSIINNGTINVLSKGNLVQVNHPKDLNNNDIITPTINFTKNTGDKIRWDYIYWSKPVSSNVISNFTDFDLKYYWDPDFCDAGINQSYLGWRTLSSEPNIATGFITRVKTSIGTTPTPLTLNYSGTSNNGNYTPIVKYYDGNDSAFRNFTLLGNPYPGAIKFEDFYNDNKDKIFGTVYLWSSNTPYPGSGLYAQADYATFNLSGGVGVAGAISQSPNTVIPNNYIASGQAFMVRSKVVGTATFKNSQRTKDIPSNNQFFRGNNNDQKDRYWLRITDSNGKYNESLIGYFEDEATDNFDEAYDGEINSISLLKLYSKLTNSKLIIQGKGKFDKNDIVPLGYFNNNIVSEVLQISLSKKEGKFKKKKIYIHDIDLDIYHDLSESDYYFTSTTNNDNRFEIVYKTKRKDANDSDNYDQPSEDKIVVNAYFDNLGLQINASDTMKSLLLYDITGKLILEKEINSSSFTNQSQIGIGIYILKITMADNSFRVIKIIKK